MNVMTKSKIAAALAAALLVACGGGGSSNPDAALTPDAAAADGAVADAPVTADAAPDATPPADAFVLQGSPSCDEFATPVTTLGTFPMTYSGDLAGALANLNIGDNIHCAEENAPFGKTAPGADQVVALTGLTPGARYFVKLTSDEDLLFYVVTGCDTANPGPGANQCLSFSDAFAGMRTEGERFTAPADGKAFIVVDYFRDDQAPTPTTYNLSVSNEGCFDESDCTSAANPACDINNWTCANASTCVGDDAADTGGSDDGPAGATPISLTGGPVTINASVCFDDAATVREADYYKFTVANGGALSVSMQWADAAADLDLAVLDANLKLVGLSYWENPEPIQLSFLPAGTYYIQVVRAAPASTTVTPYMLTVTPAATAACTSSASCASVFRNQIFRPTCNAQGACVAINGAGAVAAGGVCDSADDCVTGTLCASFPFIANADTRSVCTKTCTSDTDCASVGTGFKCTTGGNTNFCLPPCTANNQCPSSPGNTPPTGQPWTYATCTVAEGRCTF